jgi:anti-sigma regulatory factor (Ser/Thr protein kinase)
MTKAVPYTFQVKFPGDIEYIPTIRKFVSEVLLANNFTPKFAYRSEIIIDEICNNAVSFGCLSVDAAVELTCEVHEKHIELMIKDEGGRKEDIKRLKLAVNKEAKGPFVEVGNQASRKESLGLEIVRMLSENVSVDVDKNNLTSIKVVKARESESAADEPEGVS